MLNILDQNQGTFSFNEPFPLFWDCLHLRMSDVPNIKEIHMADKTLTCKDCSKEFIFTEGEQEFYKEKGLTNEPQRCPECRKAKKQQFNRNNYDRRY